VLPTDAHCGFQPLSTVCRAGRAAWLAERCLEAVLAAEVRLLNRTAMEIDQHARAIAEHRTKEILAPPANHGAIARRGDVALVDGRC